MSVLVSKGRFKRMTVEGKSGAAAAKRMIEILVAKGLGQLLQYRRANNTSVSVYKIVILYHVSKLYFAYVRFFCENRNQNFNAYI